MYWYWETAKLDALQGSVRQAGLADEQDKIQAGIIGIVVIIAIIVIIAILLVNLVVITKMMIAILLEMGWMRVYRVEDREK